MRARSLLLLPRALFFEQTWPCFPIGLGPFVAARSGFGSVGQVVTILGNNLTGSTSVTFNGTTAKFKVVSVTYIQAQVPAGATTGMIEVTTPTETLSRNIVFLVP